MLSPDVCSDVFGSADREQGQKVGIRIDLLDWGRTVSHGSYFTPLRNWVDGMPKTKATLLLVCCGDFLP